MNSPQRPTAIIGEASAGWKIRGLRWWIVALLFLASVLNYVDRQALSILAPTIQADLRMTNDEYATVLNVFLVCYLVATLLSGKLVDRAGVRVSFAIFVGWWSVANMLTALAKTVGGLSVCRGLLGLGEAGNWTAAPKAVSEWFPVRERALAIGIYTLGATIGATIAPALVIGLSAWQGWQSTFIVIGLAGLLWLVPWLLLYRKPEVHKHITDRERALINDSSAMADHRSVGENWGSWSQLLCRREIWFLILGRMLTDPVWYFFQFWFAKYLYDARGVDQGSLSITWVIFLAADIGALSGGWVSGLLVKGGMEASGSRLRIMLGSAVLIPAAAFIPFTDSLGFALALGMIAVLAHMAWLINLSSLVVDLVPKASLATTFGIVAAGSSVGGIVMNKAVGWSVSHHSYDPAFYAMLFTHPIAWVILRQTRRRRNAAGSA